MPINLTSTTRLRELIFAACISSLILISSTNVHAQFLEKQLVAEGVESLAKASKADGDAKRGAVVFYQPYMSCAKCHIGDKEVNRLGPELAKIDKKTTDAQIVESILEPSKIIKKEYQPVKVLLENGNDIIGLLDSETKTHLLLRDPSNGKLIKLSKDEIDTQKNSKLSIMPAGQVNSLSSRQQFLDLVKYLIEIRDGGIDKAKELEPAPELYAKRPLPKYEKNIDHAGMISSLDQKSYQRGKAIYSRLCVNCHGTHDKPGSLPTSLKFASGKFKNGHDPYTMYQTLTRGFGMMVQQSWMVPQQKYDVIHYIRQDYLKKHNTSQYFEITKDYLAQLPKGTTKGPKPSNVVPWKQMDYGHNLIATYEIGSDKTNFAYKGNAIRLDQGPGGVTQGRYWMVYDYDTMRVAAIWNGKEFIDYRCIHFDGRHNIHPRIAGNLTLENKTGPGWANPETGDFKDDRVIGRDKRMYGPLPEAWAKYRGMFYHGQKVIISYTVGKSSVLEMPSLQLVPHDSANQVKAKKKAEANAATSSAIYQRTFNIGSRDRDMILQVANYQSADGKLQVIKGNDGVPSYVIVGGATQKVSLESAKSSKVSAAAASGDALIAGVVGNLSNGKWTLSDDNNLRLHIPKGKEPLQFTLWMATANESMKAKRLASLVEVKKQNQNLVQYTKGGAKRWPQEMKVEVQRGKDEGPFALDVFPRPVNNPWFCRMRLTGLDFYPDGDRMLVCDWEGNVWHVSGLSKLDAKQTKEKTFLTWRRIASGLFQPLGIKIVDNKIYVTCRDQLCILNDLNGDGEIDYYQNFNNDHQVTDHFHEFAMGLQVDKDGNFLYAKSARHALKALVPHHGTLLRVSKDGSKTEIVANGFRAANGVCINPDGTFIVTDQEGHWNPKNRINYVTKGGFYGNMFGYHDVTDSSDSAMQQPLCWITNSFDRSPAELMWIDSKAWGPLNGILINFSYGYGKVYVVPHEKINGQVQGGMCAFPIPKFPTGVMRGRFHPKDKQLYTCGMFAWAGSQHQPGGLYRIRYTGKGAYLPLGLKAKKTGMEITFSDSLDSKEATNVKNYQIKIWDLKRTRGYGSKHYNEKKLVVTAAKLSADGKTVKLTIPKIAPTWCMEIKCKLKTSKGEIFERVIHNTIHNLGS